MAYRHTVYVSEVRAAAAKVFDGVNALKSLQAEYTAGGYADTLPTAEPGAANEGITKADVAAVVFTTGDALAALLAGGHATNIVKVL